MCPCNKSEQSVYHILYECDLVKKERKKERIVLLKHIQKTEKWPVTKNTLISKHLKKFNKFVDSEDFEKLQ